MKLSDLKAKGADKLDEHEIEVLRNNQDKLSDEDKGFFASILKEEEGLEEEGLTFKSEEDLNKYLEERDQKKLEAEEEAKRQEELAKQGEVFFDKNELPLDWNDAFRKATPKIISKWRGEVQKEQEEQRQKIAEINKGFDDEIVALRGAGEDIPKAGTEEYKKFDKELNQIAVDYGLTNMTGAYKILKMVKSQQPTQPTQPVIQPATTQKSVAKRVGKSGGGEGGKEIKYSDIKGKSMDELIDEEMETLE